MGIYDWNRSGYKTKRNKSCRTQYWDKKSSNLHSNKKTLSVVFYFYLFSSHTFTLHPNRSLPHLLSSEHPPHLPFRKELTSQGFETNTHNKLQKIRHNLLYHGHTILNTLNLIHLGILISLSLTTEKRVYIYLFIMTFRDRYLRLWLEC